MPPSTRWPEAALAGLASSMRTFASPAALAVRGRVPGKLRALTLLAAAGEIVVDKLPAATDRIEPPALGGRIAAGGLSGGAIAGPAGLAGGAVSAFAGSFPSFRARKLIVDATGLPDPVVAVGEDLLAYTAAAAATHEGDGAAIRSGAVRGLAAAGTAAMTIAQGAGYVLTPAKPSSAPADVADRLKRLAGLGRVKRNDKPAVNQAMHWLYGSSWGVPLGIAAAGTDVRPELAGPAFGLFVWVTGLAHQPLLGIADVPWKRSPASLGSEALLHLVYGFGAAAALRALQPSRHEPSVGG